MIITIDGPAASGKSTAARGLAQRLGFEFLDTGAMYRAVTLAVLRHGTDPSDEAALARLLDGIQLELPLGKVVLNGEDVTGLIRNAEVTVASGPVADNALVRRVLAGWQRRLAAGHNIVCEGRDQGTVVFPDAQCKFFLVANPEERARRRQQEMVARGERLTWEEILKAQEARDRRDTVRPIAPMVPAPDAILLDSTYLRPEQVLDQMEQEVSRRGSKR
jgi:cytidylate kinase